MLHRSLNSELVNDRHNGIGYITCGSSSTPCALLCGLVARFIPDVPGRRIGWCMPYKLCTPQVPNAGRPLIPILTVCPASQSQKRCAKSSISSLFPHHTPGSTTMALTPGGVLRAAAGVRLLPLAGCCTGRHDEGSRCCRCRATHLAGGTTGVQAAVAAFVA